MGRSCGRRFRRAFSLKSLVFNEIVAYQELL